LLSPLLTGSYQDNKIVIALIAVLVGWVLAQGTALFMDFYRSWRLKRALLEELEDLREQLERVVMSYRRQLQMYALNGIEGATPHALLNLFFKQYYKDVFYRLNRQQRLSFQLIHGTIDSLNEGNKELLSFLGATQEKLNELQKDQGELEGTIEDWGNRVKALYYTARDAMFYIDFHLRNPQNPKLDFRGPMHKSYLRFNEEVKQEIENVIVDARKLKREDFEKFYDDKFFPPEKPKNE
jgi:hypothetical protein